MQDDIWNKPERQRQEDWHHGYGNIKTHRR